MLTDRGPTLRTPAQRRCSHAPRHRWHRLPERDLDLGDAYRCCECLTVAWREHDGPHVTLQRVAADHVDDVAAARLIELTFGDSGLMARTFLAARRGTFTGVCFIARDRHDRIVGWGLRWRAHSTSRWSLHVFVEPRHRRQGIGAVLVAAARKTLRRPLIAHPSTDEAFSFYARWTDDPGVEIRDHRASLKDAS
ncbi:MAG TPA: GNAT family N-acetyltransferase [Acidimicrobiales bacterium]|nr:GNAT family N-acetyltransferase [Acidimicrobiales bacterium]